MSDLGDYLDEMGIRRVLDDRTVEALLDGRVPVDRDDLLPIAGFVQALSDSCATAEPTPDDLLLAVFAEGMPDLTTDNGNLPVTAARNVHGPAQQAAGLPKWRRATSMLTALLSAIAAKLGAMGLAAKGALALTATAAVVAGGVAADLPERALDALAGRNAPDSQLEEVETLDVDETDLDDETDGERQDGDHRQSPEDNPADEAAEEGLNRARENTADTPAQIPDSVGPGAAAERRPEGTPAGPPEGTPAGPPEGTSAGAPEGTPAGPPEGTPAGPPEGTPQGAPEGTPDGQPEDTPAGQPEDTPAGPPDGTPPDQSGRPGS